MKARSAKGEQTRLRIIRTAADLFHKQGVGATSPDDVIEASETGKGQFYHYFKSKEGLVHAVLQAHLATIEAGTAHVDYDVNSWKDLERWFVSHLALQQRYHMTRGCPFGTIANEVTEDDELVRQDLSLIFEVMKHKLARFFVREKAAGRLVEAASEERLADFCLATIQGGMLLGKVRRRSQPVEAVVREALEHLSHYTVPRQPSTGSPALGDEAGRPSPRPRR